MASGLKGIKTVKELNVKDKVVFLRLDLNVPLEKGHITDETRITASLPTIQYLMDQGSKIIMASHLGRPKAAGDKKYSMEPVGKRLSELLKAEVILIEDPAGDGVKPILMGLKKGQLILLENVRYVAGETENSNEFAQRLAKNVDVYINDAFGASHRAHATIHALPELIKEKGIGFLIEKEIHMLDQLIDNPKSPYLAILGGAKKLGKFIGYDEF